MEIINIAVVHAYDKVEPFEIRGANHATSVVKVKSAPECGVAHPAVGKVSGVSTVESCRIKFRTLVIRHIFGNFPHYTFCRRAAADIAEADKKYADGALGWYRRELRGWNVHMDVVV